MKQWYAFHTVAVSCYGGNHILVQAEDDSEALALAKTDPRLSGSISSELKPVPIVDMWTNAISWKATVYVNSDSVEILNVRISTDSSKPLIALNSNWGDVNIKRVIPRSDHTYYATWPSNRYYVEQSLLQQLTVGSSRVIHPETKLDLYRFGETSIAGVSLLDKASRAVYIEKIRQQAMEWVDDQIDRQLLHITELQQNVKRKLLDYNNN